MRKCKYILAMIVFTALPLAASAETNAEFYGRCRLSQSEGYCLSPFEALTSMADSQGRAGNLCLPVGFTSSEQINNFMATYLRWVEKHPEKSGEAYFQGISDALLEIYACEQ